MLSVPISYFHRFQAWTKHKAHTHTPIIIFEQLKTPVHSTQWALSEPLSYRQRFQGREEAQVAYQKATAFEALVG
jgi:hypothetical protein